MRNDLLAIFLVALVVLSGCLQSDPTAAKAAARNLPEVKEILEEYPNAYVSALYLSEEAVVISAKSIKKDCGNDMKMRAYWYFTITADDKRTEVYIDESLKEVACIVKPKEDPKPLEHKCQTYRDCDDNLLRTRDECIGRPRECVHTIITECGSVDGYCPPGCVYSTDTDCEAVDECFGDVDCSDSNRLTKDICSGTPRACSYELKTCEELGEALCEEFEVCLDKSLPFKGRGVCCDEACVKTKSCEGVECPENYKCVNGECYEMSCADRQLELCASNEICDGEYYRDSLGISCCTGECKQPCENDAECGLDRVCEDGYCVFASCGDAGGKTCNAAEVCVGEKIKAADSYDCCTHCILKTCEEREGEICQISEFEFCPQNTVQTLDTYNCCLNGCDINACLEVPCGVNEKCDYITCVEMNCEERGGTNCLSRICDGNLAITPDSLGCCIGTCFE